MANTDTEVAMARAGRPQLVLLPRDPEVAYVYWEWPGGADLGTSGELTVLVDGPEGSRRVVERFEVRDESGGRFVRFAASGVEHQCELRWGDQVLRGDIVVAPRKESGEEPPAFVRVRLDDGGLDVEPTEHEHPAHGTFPAAKSRAPSSHRFD